MLPATLRCSNGGTLLHASLEKRKNTPSVHSQCCVLTTMATHNNTSTAKVALVDGAGSGVARHLMPLKRLSITNINIKDDIDKAGAALRKVKKDKAKNKNAKPRVSNFKKVEKAFKDADVAGKWAATSWAKGIAKKAAKVKKGNSYYSGVLRAVCTSLCLPSDAVKRHEETDRSLSV
jgi:hypothetical protein